MEKLFSSRRNKVIAAALSAIALTGCTVDSYLTDPSNVHCDSRRTKVGLSVNSMAAFIVHGNQKDEVAVVRIRRNEAGASVAVSGDVTGPPQQFEGDGFTAPTPVANGTELSAFGAGGAWIIDVRKNSVVIQGTCAGM